MSLGSTKPNRKWLSLSCNYDRTRGQYHTVPTRTHVPRTVVIKQVSRIFASTRPATSGTNETRSTSRIARRPQSSPSYRLQTNSKLHTQQRRAAVRSHYLRLSLSPTKKATLKTHQQWRREAYTEMIHRPRRMRQRASSVDTQTNLNTV